ARGEVRPLDEDLRWQPVLWRALVADTGELASSSRAHIHNRFMAAGAAAGNGTRPADLPPRIVVFGVSSLPRQALEALHVLSRFSQIVLCVHNPCQFYWADIVSDRDLLRAERRRGRLDHPMAALTDPDQIHQHANPLLAAWGKQGRDYIRLLDVFDNPDDYRERLSTPGGSIDIYRVHGDEEDPAPLLLHQIQNDIFRLTPQQDMLAGNRVLDPASDDSVVFHDAHSPQREVEVLHDQLLAAFSQDPDLRPRDVIVMVPDINAYAPHIQAVFGRYAFADERHIPFTISDQGQRHRQPLLIALETLLSLPEQRFGVSEVVSLLEVPALRARFGIAEDDLPQLRQWVEGANIRWGLHEQQRASLELPEQLHTNTWQFGLRRMLLGYSMGHEQAWQTIESFGEVAGLQAALAGQLTEFVGQLERLWLALGKSRTPTDWLTLLTDLLADFFQQPDEQDLLLIRRLQDQAERWLLDCDSAGMTGVLPLNIVRDVLLEGLDEGGLNQRFLAGKVNFATLMPMRAIPFRRVCLLGMNDGDYPRSRPPVDFDLMAQDYRPGDRSRREDDRYLFLEALLSAREQLYISWVGRSIRDDSERPPSVLVAQLRDHLNDVWSLPQGDDEVAQALTTRHPLQPFSRAYFPPDSRENDSAQQVVRSGRLFTYDSEWRGVHLEGE
ncbi:exodeoxyribonuclease V subunit gamma, partial [uncultured Marinobacter sp.]|uniref:exodeoxyribonuclease V subunit gamma n=1 Tax=uncultured Marinobacter sp. TaxID=187379 RepID=UPI0030DD0A25